MKKQLIFLLGCCLSLPFLSAQNITIDVGQQFQTMVGFAASDCWTGNFVGKYWNADKKEQIAKWLFSQTIPTTGYAQGIGLSMWRVNLGAGTYEQGSASGITDETRRAECFLDSEGNYDWTKQAGQQYFMQKAKEYGCEHFVAFSNSPPVLWTRNNKGYSGSSTSANLQDDKYDEFAGYLTDVVKHFSDDGYNFSYISPVNEPQYEWTGTGQEGSPWTNTQIKKIVTELNTAIVDKNLNTKILVTEAGSYDYIYSSPTSHPNTAAGNQINFFNSTHSYYIGNLPSVAPVIGAHGYWTYGTTAGTINVRTQLKNYTSYRGVEVFQTEWSLLDAAPTDGFTSYEASTAYGDIAVFTARMIYFDLVYAGVSSWSWWTAMDMERYGQKNRFMLIALEPGGNFYNPPTMTGNIYARPNLWALGNYSLFVRPGYKRIQLTTGVEDLDGLIGTAYIAPDSSKIIAVYVNQCDSICNVSADFVGLAGKKIVKQNMYYSNGSTALRQFGNADSQIYESGKTSRFPARSVITMVYDLEDTETAIRDLPPTTPYDSQAPVYDLLGRKVGTAQTLSKLKAGVYIVGKQKMVVQ